MSNTLIKTIVWYKPVGKNEDGSTKSKAVTIGSVIKMESGHLRMKLDVEPLNWDGWADIFDYEPKPAKKEQNPF